MVMRSTTSTTKTADALKRFLLVLRYTHVFTTGLYDTLTWRNLHEHQLYCAR